MRLQEIQEFNPSLTQKRVKGIELSNQLNDEFQAIADNQIGISNHLAGTQKAYQYSMKKLYEGSGNLVRRAEKLKKLGTKASKQIDRRLIDRSEL